MRASLRVSPTRASGGRASHRQIVDCWCARSEGGLQPATTRRYPRHRGVGVRRTAANRSLSTIRADRDGFESCCAGSTLPIASIETPFAEDFASASSLHPRRGRARQLSATTNVRPGGQRGEAPRPRVQRRADQAQSGRHAERNARGSGPARRRIRTSCGALVRHGNARSRTGVGWNAGHLRSARSPAARGAIGTKPAHPPKCWGRARSPAPRRCRCAGENRGSDRLPRSATEQ